MLESLGDHLRIGGRLYLPTGTIQAEETILTAACQIFGAHNIAPVLRRRFPLPNMVAGSRAVQQLLDAGVITAQRQGSRLVWCLTVWRCVRA